MNDESQRVTLHVKRHFDASAERVFDAWLDPSRAGKWLFATPTGRMVRVDIDARVGGQFRFVDRRDGDDVEHVGEYREIERPRRLVFTFAVPKFSSEHTLVSVDIRATAHGCDLTLTHERVLPEWAAGTEDGWTRILDALANALADTLPAAGGLGATDVSATSARAPSPKSG